ncbi:hypothetical protein ABPG72_004527 [Tetrahymena utriculariae]
MDQNKPYQRIVKRASQEQYQMKFKNLKDLAPTGILDFQFFQKAEKDGQISVQYNQINQLFQNIENAKKFQQNPQDYQPQQYQDDINSKLKLQDLKYRISILNPSYPVNDLNTLFQGRQDITAKDMFELLKENEMLEDFDPVQEALNQFVSPSGEFDLEKVSTAMSQLGYGELDKKDKEILKECLDIDRDNKITDKDFKEVTSYINKKKYLS